VTASGGRQPPDALNRRWVARSERRQERRAWPCTLATVSADTLPVESYDSWAERSRRTKRGRLDNVHHAVNRACHTAGAGRILSMGANLSHHFLPQFHLRLFSGHPRCIHVASRTGDRIVLSASIRSQCARHKFYGDSAYESQLADAEGIVSASFRAAISAAWSGQELTGETIALLRLGVLFQRFRTPRQVRSYNEMSQPTTLHLFLSHLQTQPASAERDEAVDAITRGKAKLIDDDVETVRIALSFIAEAVELTDDLDFRVCRNHLPTPFILADSPAAYSNPFFRQIHDQAGLGLRCKGLIMVLPLNPRTCVLFFDRTVYTPMTLGPFFDLVQTSDVASLNALQLHSSETNVYFADESEKDWLLTFLRGHRALLQTEIGRFVVYRPGELLVDGKPSTREIVRWAEAKPPLDLNLSLLTMRAYQRGESHFREASTSQLHKVRADRLDDEYRGLDIGAHFMNDIRQRIRFRG